MLKDNQVLRIRLEFEPPGKPTIVFELNENPGIIQRPFLDHNPVLEYRIPADAGIFPTYINCFVYTDETKTAQLKVEAEEFYFASLHGYARNVLGSTLLKLQWTINNL